MYAAPVSAAGSATAMNFVSFALFGGVDVTSIVPFKLLLRHSTVVLSNSPCFVTLATIHP